MNNTIVPEVKYVSEWDAWVATIKLSEFGKIIVFESTPYRGGENDEEGRIEANFALQYALELLGLSTQPSALELLGLPKSDLDIQPERIAVIKAGVENLLSQDPARTILSEHKLSFKH